MLDKSEIRQFILTSLEKDKFAALFEAEDREMMKLVDQLFDLIFAEKFEDNADNVIDTYAYHDAILDHIPEDDGMQEPLLALFDPDK